MIGKTLGHYEITAELGKGGMGEVWRARDTKLGRDVAIKTLPEDFARDEERLARFEREAKLLASVNHPHIASIYGLEQSDTTRFLVLELVEGETLAERLERGPIPLEECIRLGLQIVEALEAAHERGVVHRDLKPANVKITPDGNVKVLDFGLAKAFSGKEPEVNLSNSPTLTRQATMEGVILGTAGYMSPEQAKGLPVDRRSDIFSFGCVLFEMLTGRRAFRGELATEILASIINQEPDASLLPSALHPQLNALLDRCFEKRPKNRWQAAGDIRLELSQIAADPRGTEVETSSAGPRSTLVRVLPWVAATAVVTWLVKPGSAPEPRLVARFVHELPEDQGFTNTGRSLVAVSPDGRRLVYVASSQLYVRALEDLEAHPIAGVASGTGVTSPVFSPDGEWVAYFGGEALQKIPVSGGAAVILCAATGSFGMSWGSDGTILFGQPEGIFRVPDAGGTPSLVIGAEEGEQLDSPRMLPGGDAVLFTATRGFGPGRWDQAQIAVQSLDAEERKILWSGGSDARYVETGHLVFARESALYALPFDLGRREVMGGAVTLVGSVRRANSPATNTGTANYDLSPSGALVYVAGASSVGRSVVALVDLDGRVRRLDVPPAAYFSPRISPDGQTLVVQSVEEDGESVLWTYELNGAHAMRRLVDEGNNHHPIWTPDGERITFTSDREGDESLFWMRADGTGPVERLTSADDGTAHTAESWSPDGRTLALSIFDASVQRPGLWTLSLDGERRLAPLTEVPDSFGAAFSPDGKAIAYHTYDGSFQIYVQPFPPTGVRQRLTRDEGIYPVWSPDGTTLYFRLQPDSGYLQAIDLATEPVLRFSDARELPIPYVRTVNHRGYDPMPDGEGFLMRVPEESESDGDAARPRIHIVLNWVEELKERAPLR